MEATQVAGRGYHDLEVYRDAHALAVRVHALSLSLPPHEKFEEGSQVRRSSKRVSASIVEGHALRMHKGQFLTYPYRALGSSDETQEHPRLLLETGSAPEGREASALLKAYEALSGKLLRFIQGVERRHGTPRYLSEVRDDFVDPDVLQMPAPPIRNPKSGIRNPRKKQP